MVIGWGRGPMTIASRGGLGPVTLRCNVSHNGEEWAVRRRACEEPFCPWSGEQERPRTAESGFSPERSGGLRPGSRTGGALSAGGSVALGAGHGFRRRRTACPVTSAKRRGSPRGSASIEGWPVDMTDHVGTGMGSDRRVAPEHARRIGTSRTVDFTDHGGGGVLPGSAGSMITSGARAITASECRSHEHAGDVGLSRSSDIADPVAPGARCAGSRR